MKTFQDLQKRQSAIIYVSPLVPWNPSTLIQELECRKFCQLKKFSIKEVIIEDYIQSKLNKLFISKSSIVIVYSIASLGKTTEKILHNIKLIEESSAGIRSIEEMITVPSLGPKFCLKAFSAKCIQYLYKIWPDKSNKRRITI